MSSDLTSHALRDRPWFALALALTVLACTWVRADTPVALDITDLAPPNFEIFGVKDGLSDEIFSTIGFDQQGFVWAGSASSLFRFDGYRWERYELPGAGSLVRDMSRDANGQLWAIFDREGLARLSGNDWRLHGEPGLGLQFSTSIDPNGRSTLWLIELDGVRRLVGEHWVEDAGISALGRGINHAVVRTEHLLGEPRLWLARSHDALWTRSADDELAAWERLDLDEFGTAEFTNLIVSHNHGQEELWVLTYGSGIVRLSQDGSIKRWRKADGELASEAIYNGLATYDADGERSMWIASRAGLIRFRGDDIRIFDRADGLPSEVIRGIKLQRDWDGTDILWLATEGGLARTRLSPSPWRTVSRFGASENGIFGIIVEPDGHGGSRLLIGSGYEGIAVLEDGSWRTLTREQGTLPHNGIAGLWRLQTADGEIHRLASFENGELIRFDDDLRFERLDTPWPISNGDAVIAALALSSTPDPEIWMGTRSGRIFRLTDNRLELLYAPDADRVGRIFHLTEQIDANNQSWVWVATERGLGRMTLDRFDLIDTPSQLGRSGYRQTTLIRRGETTELWASSIRHGVVRFDVTDPARPIAIEDELVPPPPDPTVYSVWPDSRGVIYVCTNNGVQQLTPLAKGGYRERVFRRSDGLVHDECNTGSQFIDRDDRFWAGTLAGLSLYDPALESGSGPRYEAGPLILTDLRVDGRRVSTLDADELIIPPGSRELSARFSMLSNQREHDNEYRARLLGLEEPGGEWSAQPYRIWGTLPPERYRLRIEARDFAGVTAAPLELSILVEPHWHERRAVQALLVFAIAGLVLGLVLLYNRRLRRRKSALEGLVATRTSDLESANQLLTELSYRDSLTQLANRRRLDEAAAEVLEQARIQRRPISLILLDIDEFKEFNDRFGHLAGDVALQCLARQLERILRPEDLIARFGGEEFACLLPNTDRKQAWIITERLRVEIHTGSKEELGNRYRPLTISAGVVSLIPDNQTLEEILSSADQALYQAKQDGRNLVVMAPQG